MRQTVAKLEKNRPYVAAERVPPPNLAGAPSRGWRHEALGGNRLTKVLWG